MPVQQITADNLETTVKEGIVLLDFWASWCGPCRMFAPVFEKAAEKHGDIVFGKVDTEAERGLAAGFQIQAIPTLMAFRDGILVFSQPGALPGSSLEKLIQAVRELDMDEVRERIAAQREGGESDAASN